MRRVVGLDLDLAKCGIGIITRRARGDCVLVSEKLTAPLRKTGPPDAKGKPAESLTDRYARIADMAVQVCHFALMADLVVVESKFSGSPGGKSIDRHGVLWYVMGRCIKNGIPVAEISPKSVKLAVTGDGNADKAAVAGALGRLWPDWTVGSDDESDAAGCAHLGAVWLGWPVKTLERHRQVKAAWPVLLNDDGQRGDPDAA